MTDDRLSVAWASAFRAIGQRWGRRKAARNAEEFMAGSAFGVENRFAFRWVRSVPVDEVLLRALTYGGTTADRLGSRKEQFLSELRAAILPYSAQGMLREVIIAAERFLPSRLGRIKSHSLSFERDRSREKSALKSNLRIQSYCFVPRGQQNYLKIDDRSGGRITQIECRTG
jgi:hypothetical protein